MQRELEEILEAIWNADEEGDSSVANVRRNCPDPVEQADLTLLHKRGLVTPDGERLLLTYEGRSAARGVIRRHRLAETLFATVLNLGVDERERVACEVEHALLPEVEEGICTLLGHPTVGPDGKPIPPGNCCDSKRTMAASVVVNLTSLAPGERGRVAYIKPKDHGRLHRLTSFGLTPGTVIELHQTSPAVCVRYEGTELAIDRDVAEDIFVARVE